MPRLRLDQALITVNVAGINLPVSQVDRAWSALEGGDLESEDTKVRPGGMQAQVNLGGPSTRTDATVLHTYSTTLHPYIVHLENVAGKASMNVSYTVLDSNGAVAGPTVTISGILKTVNRPNFDANTTGAAYLSLVMGCNVAASISN